MSAEREREALEGQLAAEKAEHSANAVELVRKLEEMRETHKNDECTWAAKLDSKAVEEAMNSANAAELVQKLEEMRGTHGEQEEIWAARLEDAAASALLVSETRAALAAAEEKGTEAAARVVELEDKFRSSEARVEAAAAQASDLSRTVEGLLVTRGEQARHT